MNCQFAVLFCLASATLFSQERVGSIQVRVATDHADWRYEPGQPVRFHIAVIQDGHPLLGAQVTYKIGPEMMPPKIDKAATLSSAEGLTVDGGTLEGPGFLRCIATVEQNGKTYRGLATAAFRPEAIQATQVDPTDFDQFWASGRAALAKLPIDAKVSLLPEYGNSTVDCYHVNLQNVGGTGAGVSRLYGILCEPKAPGKYPALLSVPGAGVRPYRGLAAMAARGRCVHPDPWPHPPSGAARAGPGRRAHRAQRLGRRRAAGAHRGVAHRVARRGCGRATAHRRGAGLMSASATPKRHRWHFPAGCRR